MAWTTPSTVSVAQLGTAALWNQQVRDNLTEVWHEMAYVEFTANVTANTVAEASATVIVTTAAITLTAVPTTIEFFCPALVWGGAGTTSTGINLWDGATDLGRLFDGTTAAQPVVNVPGGVLKRRLTPTAGSHTYSARIWSSTAVNFIAAAGAGGVGTKLPGFILVQQRGA